MKVHEMKIGQKTGREIRRTGNSIWWHNPLTICKKLLFLNLLTNARYIVWYIDKIKKATQCKNGANRKTLSIHGHHLVNCKSIFLEWLVSRNTVFPCLVYFSYGCVLTMSIVLHITSWRHVISGYIVVSLSSERKSVMSLIKFLNMSCFIF